MNQNFKDLVAYTHLYLVQNYKNDESVVTDPETYTFLKRYSNSSKPAIKKAPPTEMLPDSKKVEEKTAPPDAPKKVDAHIEEKITPSDAPKKVESHPEKKKAPPLETSLKVNLEKVATTVHSDHVEMQKIIKELFPQLHLHSTPPDDTLTKTISNRWKNELDYPEVVILTSNESQEELTFLSSIAKGIQQKLAPSTLMTLEKWEAELDKEKQSRSVRLILVGVQGVALLKSQINFDGDSCSLRGIALITLAELSTYSQNPELKTALWKNIQRALLLAKSAMSR